MNGGINLKKKVPSIILTTIIVILVLGIMIQAYVPKKIISDKENINFQRMLYHGSEIFIDENEILNILSKYRYRITFQRYFPYQNDKIDIEIDLIDNHEPKHILLGEFNIWYESRDKGAYNILKSQELKNEINRLLE